MIIKFNDIDLNTFLDEIRHIDEHITIRVSNKQEYEAAIQLMLRADYGAFGVSTYKGIIDDFPEKFGGIEKSNGDDDLSS